MHDRKFIGYDAKQEVGYGNISHRHHNSDQFLISGTQTGHLEQLAPEHFSLVTTYDLANNKLQCHGPIQASAESLTHAALYNISTEINAVIHIHNVDMWETLKHQIPTSSEAVPYGTPEMAFEMQRLYRETEFSKHKMAVMGGHYEGLIAFGASVENAVATVLQHVNL